MTVEYRIHHPPRRWYSVALCLGLCLFIPFSLGYAGQFQVVNVSDDLTIHATGHDVSIIIRLAGIDALDLSLRKSQSLPSPLQQAKQYLVDHVLNKTIDIKSYGIDSHNRVLGELTLNGLNINLEILRAGFVLVSLGHPPQGLDLTPYYQVEREARTAKQGIWAQKGWQNQRGFLGPLPDGWMMLFLSLIFLAYLVCFFPLWRRGFVQNYWPGLLAGLPGTPAALTLLGLVLSTLAIVTRLVPLDEVIQFDKTLMSLTGSAVFLFAYIFFSYAITAWTVYFTVAAMTASLYCLGLSLFALLDILLPDRAWRFILIAAPVGACIYTVITLTAMFRTKSSP